MNTAVRSLVSRPGVGLTANVVQKASLRLSSVAVDSPALIMLHSGRKTLSRGTRKWTLEKGDAAVVAGGQVLDIENRLSADGLFEARWVVWDASLFGPASALVHSRRKVSDVAVLKRLPADFASAIDRAVGAISDGALIPQNVAGHRLIELFLWLAEHGVQVAPHGASSTTSQLRGMISAAPSAPWTAAEAAGRIAASEATLRRRLAAEGTSFNAVLTDTRMSLALTLLQSTELPVAAIAGDVGYESASRFAIRFKSRFGFAPSVVRGHHR